ncbi:MAG: cell division ATP-binding protein FtsE [Oligoflexia bacterium]|nr:cell division ATP-binding protein FtsE [Oligoflexia bacterium]
MIELTHVYKIYGNSIHALSNVSLKIDRGEFIYLTGPSGAGKTTLFKLITCYDQPTSGKIIVAGQDLSSVTASQIPYVRRKIGVVFQDFKLLKNRTVYENVALPLEILNMKRSEVAARVHDMLDQVGLRYKAIYWPEQLSGGEQQRVAIARALVGKPGLLIADEPTGNLDQNLSDEIMELFAKINAQGTTVFIATHNQSFITRGNRRVVRLEKGHFSETHKAASALVDDYPLSMTMREL